MAYKNKEDQKAWVRNNREKVSANKKAWAEKNKESEVVRKAQWKKDNKEKVEADSAMRRLQRKNVESLMTKEDKDNWASLVKIRDDATKLFGYAWHIDHIIPLSLGGTNKADNLQVVPATWNLIKNNKNSEEYWQS